MSSLGYIYHLIWITQYSIRKHVQFFCDYTYDDEIFLQIHISRKISVEHNEWDTKDNILNIRSENSNYLKLPAFYFIAIPGGDIDLGKIAALLR